eukprot:m51a1_g1321 hypothetical protein (1104) ;mRNA; f:250561-254119
MTAPTSLAEAEALCEVALSGGPSHAAAEASLSLLPPPSLAQLLSSTPSPHAALYCSRSLRLSSRSLPPPSRDSARSACSAWLSRASASSAGGGGAAQAPQWAVSSVCAAWGACSRGCDAAVVLAEASRAPTRALALALLRAAVAEHSEAPPAASCSLSSHRDQCSRFRDTCLAPCLRAARDALASPAAGPGEVSSALALALECLRYDFSCGASPATDSQRARDLEPPLLAELVQGGGTEDIYEHVPAFPLSWAAEFWAGEGPGCLVDVLYGAYAAVRTPPESAWALECVAAMTSAKRSFYEKSGVPALPFVSKVLRGASQLMTSRVGLEHQENHHALCKLFAQERQPHMFEQALLLPNWPDIAQTLVGFTLESLKAWQWAGNSVHFLLGIWSYMSLYCVGCTPEEVSEAMVEAVLETTFSVTSAYIASRLEAIAYLQQNHGAGFDDPLDDNYLSELMLFAPFLFLSKPAKARTTIFGHIDNAVGALFREGKDSSRQLAWLFYLASAFIRRRDLLGADSKEEDNADAYLLSRCITTLSQLASRDVLGSGSNVPIPKTSLAIILRSLMFLVKRTVKSNQRDSDLYCCVQSCVGEDLGLLLSRCACAVIDSVSQYAPHVAHEAAQLLEVLLREGSDREMDLLETLLTGNARLPPAVRRSVLSTFSRLSLSLGVSNLLEAPDEAIDRRVDRVIRLVAPRMGELVVSDAQVRSSEPWLRSAAACVTELTAIVAGLHEDTPTDTRAIESLIYWLHPQYTQLFLLQASAADDSSKAGLLSRSNGGALDMASAVLKLCVCLSRLSAASGDIFFVVSTTLESWSALVTYACQQPPRATETSYPVREVGVRCSKRLLQSVVHLFACTQTKALWEQDRFVGCRSPGVVAAALVQSLPREEICQPALLSCTLSSLASACSRGCSKFVLSSGLLSEAGVGTLFVVLKEGMASYDREVCKSAASLVSYLFSECACLCARHTNYAAEFPRERSARLSDVARSFVRRVDAADANAIVAATFGACTSGNLSATQAASALLPLCALFPASLGALAGVLRARQRGAAEGAAVVARLEGIDAVVKRDAKYLVSSVTSLQCSTELERALAAVVDEVGRGLYTSF